MSKQLILGTISEWVICLLSLLQYDRFMIQQNPDVDDYQESFEKNLWKLSELFSNNPEYVYAAYCLAIQDDFNYNAIGKIELTHKFFLVDDSLIRCFSNFFMNCGVKNAEQENAYKRFFKKYIYKNIKYTTKLDRMNSTIEVKPYKYNDFWIMISIAICNALVSAHSIVFVNEWYLCRNNVYTSLSNEEKERLSKKTKEKRFIDEKKNMVETSFQKYKNSIEMRNRNVIEKNIKPFLNIEPKIFFVRRSAFKCIYEGHTLRNIDAQVLILQRDGNFNDKRIVSGYCEKCKEFFILDSTFKDLKNQGIPLCRIVDEKTYLEQKHIFNGKALSSESILMQHGYNVRKNNHLSNKQRQQILAVLVDTEIMSKSEIISYLDFFINQRKSHVEMKEAIEKWKQDREFISAYNMGKYSRYRVATIVNI